MKINKKAALHNLGCKVNAYETEAMQQILENAGYEIVPFTEYADVYVVNTCSVTNMASNSCFLLFPITISTVSSSSASASFVCRKRGTVRDCRTELHLW